MRGDLEKAFQDESMAVLTGTPFRVFMKDFYSILPRHAQLFYDINKLLLEKNLKDVTLLTFPNQDSTPDPNWL